MSGAGARQHGSNRSFQEPRQIKAIQLSRPHEGPRGCVAMMMQDYSAELAVVGNPCPLPKPGQCRPIQRLEQQARLPAAALIEVRAQRESLDAYRAAVDRRQHAAGERARPELEMTAADAADRAGV